MQWILNTSFSLEFDQRIECNSNNHTTSNILNIVCVLRPFEWTTSYDIKHSNLQLYFLSS